MEFFESRLRGLVKQLEGSNPGFFIDIEKELAYYSSIREEILEMTIDTIEYSNAALKDGKRILIEGANATMIDLDFGTFPYVTSSNPTVVCIYICINIYVCIYICIQICTYINM
jgi:adenylosuccinate synthase